MPFSKRDGRAAIEEMVPEDQIEYHQLHDDKGKPLDSWVHWEPATQKATLGPKPKAPKMIKTGSRLQVEDHCHDCGAGLIAGTNYVQSRKKSYPFDYLQCARLDPNDPQAIVMAHHDLNTDGVVTATRIVKHFFTSDEAPEPHAGSVIECGRFGLLPENGPFGPTGRPAGG